VSLDRELRVERDNFHQHQCCVDESDSRNLTESN